MSSQIIKDLIIHIQQCNHDIDSLSKDNQASEQRLKEFLGHEKFGAGTYEFQDYAITITTGFNYTLDKNKFADYMLGSTHIDPRYSIVKQVTKYELNNKSIKDCDLYGTEQDRKLKDSFIKQSEKKLHVKIVKKHPEIIDDMFNNAVDSVSPDDRNGFGDY